MQNSNDFYGVDNVSYLENEIERHVEAINVKGYSVIEDVLSQNEIEDFSQKIEEVYQEQCLEIDENILASISEKDVARCLIAYNKSFLGLLQHPRVIPVIQKALGSYFILHLQNAIINRPTGKHHQSSWHRDLPYQSFVCSKPLAVNAFFCLSDFNEETGGTMFLPFSHKVENLPSLNYLEENKLQPNLKAGSVILFDSMLFHRAGTNRSKINRIGVNHVYATGIIKQQIDLPRVLKGRFSEDPALRILLGYDGLPASSVKEYRETRLDKAKK